MSRPTRVKGGRTETQSAGETDEDPPLDTTSERVPPDRSQDPASCITYQEYCADMVILSRFVSEEGYPQIARPDKYPIPNSEVLREQYRERCYVLNRLAEDGQADHIFATLDRWNVAPETLREVPNPEDLRRLFNVEKFSRIKSIQSVTGFLYLEMMTELFVMMNIAWKGHEPVEFWLRPDWQVGVPAHKLNGIPASSKEMKTKLCQPVQQLRSIPSTPALYSAESQNLRSGLQNPNAELLTPHASLKMQALDAFASLASASQETSLLSVEQIPGNAVKPESKTEVPTESKQRCFREIPCAESALDDGTTKQTFIWRGDLTRVHWLRVNNVARCLTMVVVQSVYQGAYPKLVDIQVDAEQARDEAMIGNEFKVFDRGKVKIFSESDSIWFESVSDVQHVIRLTCWMLYCLGVILSLGDCIFRLSILSVGYRMSVW